MALTARPFSFKITVTAYVIAGLFGIIFCRLVHLQIIQWRHLYTKSQKNFLRIEVVPPLRGNIIDRNGILLATNRPTINVYWQGTGNKKLAAEQITNLKTLDTILQKTAAEDPDYVTQIAFAEKLCRKLPLAEDISYEQLSKIVEQLPDQKNITITTHFKRYYPFKSSGCHALGYLGKMNAEMYGKMGLEKLFEQTLRGQQGEKLKTINSVGRHLSEIQTKQAHSGEHITTTLDMRIQEIIEEVFPKDWTGTFLLLDPEDGSIVAMLSRPDFDPTLFLEPLDHQDWLSLQNKHPFMNRAFNACYPPGSLFKIVTLSAALEHHYVKPEGSWFCGGHIQFAGRDYYCHQKQGHGYLTTEQAIAQSCNVLFYELGKRMNIDLIAEYAHRYGLGQKTNVMFAEKPGLVPSTTWKKRVKGEKWWPGETLSAAIGQSYLLVTPIQIACMMSSICTGSLVTPRILMDEEIHKQPLEIQPETRKFIQRSLKSVITQGTGQRIRQVKDIVMYAKTSTAQTSALEKRESGISYLEHGWFAGYFYYKNNKPITLVILVENSGSSSIATGLAKEFLTRYKKLMDTPQTIDTIVAA